MRYLPLTPDSRSYSFTEAVRLNLAANGSLFVPESIPSLNKDFIKSIRGASLHEIGMEMLQPFITPDLSSTQLSQCIKSAWNFDAPLIELGDGLFCLELFHGPSAAFKDFGVRFMAEIFKALYTEEVTILTATSGDTGGAVASAFLGIPGVNVVILYPEDKISRVQELQIASLGENVVALKVKGNFDDCQKIVKTLFQEGGLKSQKRLVSANSINIARLIPQICYYGRALAQLPQKFSSGSFSVPSGNFGNCTSALIAQQMGLPLDQICAVTNVNNVIPRYFDSGIFEAVPFKETLSNAMDISFPNNFPRMESLYGNSFNDLKHAVKTASFSDEETVAAMNELQNRFSYAACPHTALGYKGTALFHSDTARIFLSTAHPLKFPETISHISVNVPSHPALDALHSRQIQSISVKNSADAVRDYL